jgi:hypothetical protein
MTSELDIFRRGFVALVEQDAHAVGASALDASVCGACTRWAFAVARGSITRADVSGRCADGQAWQRDINAALALLKNDRAAPEPGHVYACCGKTGRISRHESWCPTMEVGTT